MTATKKTDSAQFGANPYQNLPASAFWKLSVGNRQMTEVEEMWTPRFEMSAKNKVVTFGSCFAQHIGRALKNRGFNWLCTEDVPDGMNEASCREFNYNVFSARTGNIYTTSLLKQWTEWALGKKRPPKEIWEQDGRYFDPFRPRVEPDGFESSAEVTASRELAIGAFSTAIREADFFVFTLGLTESWFHRKRGYEYPMCPGTAAGTYDAALHHFVNQPFALIYKNLIRTMGMMRRVNRRLRFILTVSPVPLTATNSGRNVIVATMASKSILRAVTDQIVSELDWVDYFPSYEIINSPVFKGAFFNENQRTVSTGGVEFVMNHFFNGLVSRFGRDILPECDPVDASEDDFDEVCEEAILDAFGDD